MLVNVSFLDFSYFMFLTRFLLWKLMIWHKYNLSKAPNYLDIKKSYLLYPVSQLPCFQWIHIFLRDWPHLIIFSLKLPLNFPIKIPLQWFVYLPIKNICAYYREKNVLYCWDLTTIFILLIVESWETKKKNSNWEECRECEEKKNVQHQVVIDLFSFRMFNKKKFAFNLLCILYVSPSTRMYKRILNPLISKRVE